MYSPKRRFRLFRHPAFLVQDLPTFDEVTLSNVGGDVFVSKYNSSGRVNWGARLSGSVSDVGIGSSTDSVGNVYAVGYYSSNPLTVYNADSTATTITLANDGGVDGFVVKYNATGFAQWAARISGVPQQQTRGVSVDSLGNVYVTGFYTNATITVYNADGTSFGTLTNTGANDGFIVKYDSMGVVQWATRVGGAGENIPLGLSGDSAGNTYVSGYYTGALTPYNSDGTSLTPLATAAGSDAFIVKYNTLGFAQWAARIGGGGSDQGTSISVDAAGNVYGTGLYGAAPLVIYNAGGASTISLSTTSGIDAYVVKYNSAGIAQWAARIGGTGTDQGYGISADSVGNVYTTGPYTSATLDIYNAGGGSTLSLATAGSYVVKYNTAGIAQWAVRIGGTGWAISADSVGNVYATGTFGGTVEFRDVENTLFQTIVSAGGTDVYAVKYNTGGIGQWATRIGGTGTDVVERSAISVVGNSVCVTGGYASNPLVVRSVGF